MFKKCLIVLRIIVGQACTDISLIELLLQRLPDVEQVGVQYGTVRYGTVRNFISIFFTCKFQVHSRTTGCSSKLYSTYSDCSRSNSRTIGCSSKLYSIYLDSSRSNSRTTGCSSKLYSTYSDCSRSNSRTTGCSSKLLYHCKGAEDPLFLDEGQ